MQLVSMYFGVARSKAVTLRAARPLLLFAAAYVTSWSYLFIATFLGAMPPPAPLFPPGAVLLSALLLTSPRHWWRFLVAAFLIQVPILAYLHVPPIWNVLGFTPDAVEPIVAVILIRRYLPLPLRFASLREVSVYTACIAAAVLVAATLGSAVNAVLGGEPYWSSWVSWYLGDVLACLVLAPTILLWIAAGAKGLRVASGRRFAEAALLYGGQLLVGLVVFNTRLLEPEMADALIYLPVPLLAWAAIRFGPRGIASALALIVVLAIPAVANALGPFASQSAPAAATLGDVFPLQLFLLAVGVPLFFLAALMQERAAAESTLRASEARYQAVVETQTEMITRYRPDTTLTFVNDATCRFDGKAREELLGTSILADVPEDEAARVREMIAALLAQPDPGIVTIEHQARAADGSLRWQQWVNRTVLDADGQVIELQGIGRDITELKRAEEALRESEARFRAAFESAAVGMALVGLDGHPLEVNHALVEVLGYSEQEVRSHAFAEFTYPEDMEPNLTLFQQAVAGDIEHYHVEKRYLHKAGHLVWGHLSAGVVRDAAGKPLYLVAHLQDITERKQAEQALRDSEARYRAVVSNFPQGSVLLFGEDLRHTFADGPSLQTASLIRMGVEAKTVWEAFPLDVASALELPYRAALEGRSASFDLTHDHHTYAVQVVPIQHSATRQGMVILQDVSEQRHSRDELEHERTQAVLLRALSQELRTLAEHSPDLIARFDPSGRFLYINQAGADRLGQPAEHWVGKTFADLGIPPVVFAPWAQALHDVVQMRAPRMFDIEAQAQDGQVRFVHVRFIPEFADEDGTLVSVLGIATDVSALKHAEARLAEQASELEAIFESQADGVGVYDLAGQFVRANRALRDLLGLDADADYTALPFEERAQRLRLFDEQGQTLPLEQWPQWRVLRGEMLAGASAMEAGVRTLDGRELWISITGAPVRAPDGQATGVVLIARDVTARRALERQVAEQAAELDAIFEAQADVVVVYDQNRRFVRGNRAWEEFHQRSIAMRGLDAQPAFNALPLAGQMDGFTQEIWDEHGRLIPVEDQPTARALRGEIITGSDAVDERFQSADGQDVQFSVTAAPIRDRARQITGAVLVGRDVTERRALERQVAEQASELEAIFEAKAEGVAVYDLHGRFVRANSALRQLFGFDADPEYTARPLDERSERLLLFDEQGQLLSSEQWPHWRVLRGEILAGANAMEGRVRTVDGRELWISTTGAPVRRPDGQVTGTVLMTRDVSARRALERQVAEQASQLQAIFDAIADGIVVYDRDGHVVRTNRAWQDLFRRYVELTVLASDPVFAARPVAKQIERWAELERMGQYLLRDTSGVAIPLEETPISRALRGETVTGANAVDKRVEGSDGRVYETSISAAPIRDVAGTIVGAVAVAREVTAQRQLERQVREQASELEAVFEAMADGVLVHDAQGRVLRVNQAYRRLVGAETDPDYFVRSLADRGHKLRVMDEHGQPIPEEQWASRRVLRGEVMSGQRATDMQMHTLDDRVVWVNTSGAPIRAPDGQITGAVLISRDVTARRALERQVAEQAAAAERNRLARELHDTVTQEIYSAGILADSIARNWREHRTEAEAALAQLPALTRGALAGLRVLLLELRPAALDQLPLAVLLRQLGEAMCTRANVPITVAVRLNGSEGVSESEEPPLPPAVKVVFYRVAQEALMNAAKYAKARAIGVQLRTRDRGRGRDKGKGKRGTIELEIADDGQGFDPSAIPAGHFGLAMMRERAQGVGATVQVRSELGQGTKIVVAWRAAARRAPPVGGNS